MRNQANVQVATSLRWEVTKTDEGPFVGVCESLGIAMEGDTLDDLYASIDQSVQMVMNDLLRNGELDEFLISRGWQPIPQFPRRGTNEPVQFNVPIELLMQAKRDSARHIC